MRKFVGVIDSGVGGLTVLQKLQAGNSCNFTYVADHAFCPYGTKIDEIIFSRAVRIIDCLCRDGAYAVALACNTLSVFAARLRALFDIPVYDVIAPTCDTVIKTTSSKRVALLATDATVRSNAYPEILSQSGISVVSFRCSGFVPFIERGDIDSQSCREAVYERLNALPQSCVDTVILGCTHFPLLENQISLYCGGAKIVECGCGELRFEDCDNPSTEFLTTGDAVRATRAAKWYGNVNFQHAEI
ncbi:MAG: glutamate racemase [Corallococcus sp.]|nr:glutamate racemase [Bacillota bacterium]MCM1534212.1 glutamate racemase [Corallococcus sp.]